jgi:hypothetical protein
MLGKILGKGGIEEKKIESNIKRFPTQWSETKIEKL